MTETLLVLEKRGNRMAHEEVLLAMEAAARGIPVAFTTTKALSRNQFEFTDTDIVSGSVMFVKHALRAFGRQLSEHTPYPDCLKHLLYREVRSIRSLRDAKELLDKGERFFIKPATWKSFTGFVADSGGDFRFNGTSNAVPVFTSEVVTFLGEWRVYVVKGVIRDIQRSPGDDVDGFRPNLLVIHDAVKKLTAAGAPDGYAVDFGILSTGETALVELNDGFAVGAYGDINRAGYYDMIEARWNQLKSQPQG